MSHVNTLICQSCEDKLKAVHPDLARWVRLFRSTHPDGHVAWGYRGRQDQEEAFASGHSHAHFGQSAHNTTPAMAVDFFRLTQANLASWDRPWFEQVLAPIAKAAGLIWGGDWTTIKDEPHVELPGFIPFKP